MAAAAAAVKVVAIDGGLKVVRGGVDSAVGGVTEFLSSKFKGGVTVSMDFKRPVKPGQTLKAKDCPGLRSMGIEYLKVEKGGVFYKYRFIVCNNCPLKITFICGEPDTYKCHCQRNSSHYVDFNSKKPGIYTILVQKL